MKYNAKEEYLVLVATKELGLATVEEISELLESHKFEVPANVSLVLERWKARDLLAIQYCDDGKKRYKMAKIPPPFVSVKMENIRRMRARDMGKAIQDVETEFPEGEPIRETKGKIGNYKTFQVVIETIDPILGGTPQDGGENVFKLHRNSENVPVISPAQWKGWFRENGRLIDINPNAKAWIAYSDGVPITEPQLIHTKAPVVVQGRGAGIATYEAFAPKTKLKALFRIPFRGIGIASISDIERLFKMCEVAPKRGLGANPYYFGGRIKLVEIKETPE